MSVDLDRLKVLASEGDQEAARLLLTEAKRRGDWESAGSAWRSLGGLPLSELTPTTQAEASLSFDEVREVALPLIERLLDMHSRGEAHGDLTPWGVWVSQPNPDGKRTLLDVWPPSTPAHEEAQRWRDQRDNIVPQSTTQGPNEQAPKAYSDAAAVANMLMDMSSNILAPWISNSMPYRTGEEALRELWALMQPGSPLMSPSITLYGIAPPPDVVMAPAYGLPPMMPPPPAPPPLQPPAGQGGVMRRLWRRLFGS